MAMGLQPRQDYPGFPTTVPAYASTTGRLVIVNIGQGSPRALGSQTALNPTWDARQPITVPGVLEGIRGQRLTAPDTPE
jgi:hypothetical protein